MKRRNSLVLLNWEMWVFNGFMLNDFRMVELIEEICGLEERAALSNFDCIRSFMSREMNTTNVPFIETRTNWN